MPKIIDNVEEKLIAEARTQALLYGYRAINIRSIAKECGVGVGTVYNYFPSKDALIFAFIREDWDKSLERIKTDSADGDFRTAAEVFCRELCAFLSLYRELFYDAAGVVPMPSKKYHILLREEIVTVFERFSDDRVALRAAAEILLSFTVEGESFDAVYPTVSRIINE